MNTLSNRSLAMLEANFIHAVLGSMFEAVLFTGTINIQIESRQPAHLSPVRKFQIEALIAIGTNEDLSIQDYRNKAPPNIFSSRTYKPHKSHADASNKSQMFLDVSQIGKSHFPHTRQSSGQFLGTA
jgi:hypothetical protein